MVAIVPPDSKLGEYFQYSAIGRRFDEYLRAGKAVF